jgi:hypothetical protein
MAISPTGPETKNDYTGKGQQQITKPDLTRITNQFYDSVITEKICS